MPNNTVNSGSGEGSGATTALLAILVIAVVAFGIWYVMRKQATPAQDTTGGAIQINMPSPAPAPAKP